jgi:hypothetical protein
MGSDLTLRPAGGGWCRLQVLLHASAVPVVLGALQRVEELEGVGPGLALEWLCADFLAGPYVKEVAPDGP